MSIGKYESTNPGQIIDPGARAYDVFLRCFEKGVLVRFTGDTIALAPPLIVSKQQIDELVGTLANVLREARPA